MEQVFAGIKAAGQALLDNLDKIGKAIVKIFQFDFSGAIDEIKGVVDAASSAFTAMANLTKQAQDLAKEQRQNDLEQAERQKKLAVLREQAGDDSIPIAKRKAALKELQADAEQNAKDDIDLAKRVADNRIAQLTLEKDGALKNADEINQIKIQQLGVETDNANELRRINKQVTAAEKQEQADREAAGKAFAEKQKAERQKLIDFNNKLAKLQSENELATLKDGYEKELRALELSFEEKRKANQQDFIDRKINRAQLAQLNAALDIQSNLQRNSIIDKHNEELAKKEQDFQKELAKISSDTRIKSITDTRELERVQLQIGYEEKLQDAITRYKDDATKLQAVKVALDEQLRIEQAAIDEKNRVEDAKKKLESDLSGQGAILNDPQASFDAKQAALDAEQEIFAAALDQKLITEQKYNEETAKLNQARIDLATAERDAKLATFGAIGNAFSSLSELVGKQTRVGKAFAVAAATIAAIQSAVSSFNSLSGIPIVGPALGAIAAAAAIAAGIANVKKIVAVQVPGGSGGGATVPTPSVPAAPIAPTQTSTRLDAGSINGITTAQPAVRAYVVEADNRAAANRAARLQSASVLGGG